MSGTNVAGHKRENLFVLIPAYNERSEIAPVIRDAFRFSHTVCVVDDGSTDGTGRVAKSEGAYLLEHAENRGKGAALAKGFSHFLSGNWEILVTLDGDGQHDPGAIPMLLRKFKRNNLDLLLGSRYPDMERLPWIRRITNRISSVFISVAAGRSILDTQSGYRMLHRRLVRNLSLRGTDFDFETEMLIEASRKQFNIGELNVGMPRGPGDNSKWDPMTDPYPILRILVHYYTGQTSIP